MIWRTHLCKVFADVLGGGTKVMAKRTGIAGLAGALAKELARNVGGVCHDELGQFGWDKGIATESDGSSRGSCATYSEGFGAHRSGGWWQRREP